MKNVVEYLLYFVLCLKLFIKWYSWIVMLFFGFDVDGVYD